MKKQLLTPILVFLAFAAIAATTIYFQTWVGMVSPQQYGAKGDGTTDDTTAIQTALNTGQTVVFPWTANGYKITAGLTVSTPGQQILGTGRPLIHQVTSGQPGFSVAASNVIFQGLIVEGPQGASPTYVSTEKGINPLGTYSSFLSGIRVENCELYNWGCHAIEFEYIQQSFVHRCYLHNCVRGGFVSYATSSIDVSDNVIYYIYPGDCSTSCNPGKSGMYGIDFTGDRHGNSSFMPSGNRAANNYIQYVPYWVALQTEPSSNTTFVGNTVVDAYLGINFGANPANSPYGSSYCAATGNSVQNKTLGNNVYYGIGGGGSALAYPNYANTYTGNTITGYGGTISADSGAGYFRWNTDVTINGNIFYNSNRAGLTFMQGNLNCQVKNNIFDGISNSPVAAIYVSAVGGNDNSVVEGNTFNTGSVEAFGFSVVDPLLRIGKNDYLGTGNYTNNWYGAIFKNLVDTASYATSGTTETVLATRTVPGGEMGPNGWIKFRAAGTKSGSNGNKTINLYWGTAPGTSPITVVAAANDTNTWQVEGEIRNTAATNSQTIAWRSWSGTTVAQGRATASIQTTGAISVGASPYTFTATAPTGVYIEGGTITGAGGAGSGCTVNITAASGPITGATVNAGGSGNTVGDYLLVTQSGGSGGVLQVTSVSSGAVTGVSVSAAGSGYSTANGLATSHGITKNGVQISQEPTGGTPAYVSMNASDTLTVTYSVAPAMTQGINLYFTGTCANSGDTVTETAFELEVPW